MRLVYTFLRLILTLPESFISREHILNQLKRCILVLGVMLKLLQIRMQQNQTHTDSAGTAVNSHSEVIADADGFSGLNKKPHLSCCSRRISFSSFVNHWSTFCGSGRPNRQRRALRFSPFTDPILEGTVAAVSAFTGFDITTESSMEFTR